MLIGAVKSNQIINWGPCPTGQNSTYVKDCAFLRFPLNRDDLSMGNVTSFVRRAYYGKAPTSDAMWAIAGGPGDTTISFLGLADAFVSADQSLTVYLVDQRGTGLSSPIACYQTPSGPFNPYNISQLDAYNRCNKQLGQIYGIKLQYYQTLYLLPS